MNVKFTVNKKEFESALNAVTLKGKYKSSHSSKTAVISNDVAGAISDDDMHITITASNVILKTESQRAQIPLLVEHSGITAISKIVGMEVNHASDEFPTFGRTTFETKIAVEGNVLAEAIKNCAIVGTATYRLNVSDEEFSISSVNFHQTENYKVTIPVISCEGEDSTLEFSAPLDKFCSGVMYLYLKDDAPILLCGADRKLIVAPYIRG